MTTNIQGLQFTKEGDTFLFLMKYKGEDIRFTLKEDIDINTPRLLEFAQGLAVELEKVLSLKEV